jgi:hypothetical protein
VSTCWAIHTILQTGVSTCWARHINMFKLQPFVAHPPEVSWRSRFQYPHSMFSFSYQIRILLSP